MPAKKTTTAAAKKKTTKKVAKKTTTKKTNGKAAVTKSAETKSAAKKAAPKKSNGSTARRTVKTSDIAAMPLATERDHMVAETAYYLAERRGFQPGRELEDWLQAEEIVETLVHKNA